MNSVAPVLHQLSCVITVDFDCRRRIRICCDELNLLVPFCNAETDKATTLQWTTAFLKYIQERHGDSLKKVSIHEVDFSVPELCSVKMGIFLDVVTEKAGRNLRIFCCSCQCCL